MMIGRQIEQFAQCVVASHVDEDVCAGFMRALLAGRGGDASVVDELVTVARDCGNDNGSDEAQLLLALLGLEQCAKDVASRRDEIAQFAVTELLRRVVGTDQRRAGTHDARMAVVARLVGRAWSAVRSLLLPLYNAHESCDDVPPAELVAVALVRHIVSMGERHAELARDVLPVWLRVCQQRGGKHLLPALHWFYRSPDETDSLGALLAVIVTVPVADGLPLLCRVAAQSLGAARWRVLLMARPAHPTLWQWLFECCESSAVAKAVATAYSKQAVYALREAVAALEVLREPLECLPWLQWGRDSTAADWDALLFLYDVLDNKSLHLIEPIWAHHFDTVAKRRRVPALWLRMVLRKGLCHDSVHVVRLVLLSLCQSDLSPESLWWLDADFLFGPLLEAFLRPALYRGVGGAIFPSQMLRFVKQVAMRDDLVARLVPQLVPNNPILHHNVLAVPALLQLLADTHAPCLTGPVDAARILRLARSYYRADVGWAGKFAYLHV